MERYCVPVGFGQHLCGFGYEASDRKCAGAAGRGDSISVNSETL